MTHRFPHDFWTARPLEHAPPSMRFDASLPQGLRTAGPYGFTRDLGWEPETDPAEELIGLFIDEAALDDFDGETELLDESAQAGIVHDLHPLSAPTGLYLPANYEPNYAYPLLVWFHDAGGHESDLLSLMPMISDRNAIGLSLRGSLENAQGGCDWQTNPAGISRLEKEVFRTVCRLRRDLHVHSERVFLAGVGRGADAALRLLINRAEWFAGAFALGGELPALDPDVPVHPELPARRTLLVTSHADHPPYRQWQAAGMDLSLVEDPAPKVCSPARMSQLNHWLMESVCAPV